MNGKPINHWHRLLAVLLTNLLTPVHVTVQTDVPLMTDRPKADILLLRREGDRWTEEQRARLPDGIRDHHAKHTLIEFKATESLNEDKLTQLLAYDYFYRQTQQLSVKAVAPVLLVAKKPHAERLADFGFTSTDYQGVYGSQQPLLHRMTVIVLSELENVAHNAFVKCFATQKKAKTQAFHTLESVQFGLVEATVVTFLLGLQQLWSEEEIAMSNEITPEKVMAMGEKWIDLLLATLPPEQVLEHYRLEQVLRHYRPEQVLRQYKPEDVIRQYKPEDVLSQYRPEERMSGLEPEEIAAYLQQLKKQKKRQKAERSTKE